LLLVLAFGDESAAPAPPKRPAAAASEARSPPHASTVALLPADTILYVEAESIAALERDAPWLARVVYGRSLRLQLSATIGLPERLLEPRAPVALAIGAKHPEGAFLVMVVPVRDVKVALTAAAERGWTVRASGKHIGVSPDPAYKPAPTPRAPCKYLPVAAVRGWVGSRLFGMFAGPVLDEFGIALPDLRAWFESIQSFEWAIRRDGDACVLDLDLRTGGEARGGAGDLGEALAWLPRDAPAAFAMNLDLPAAGEAIRPLLQLARIVDPRIDGQSMLDEFALLGRGMAASLTLGAGGVEVVSVMRTKDAAHFVARHAEILRARFAPLGFEVVAAPGSTVDGVSLTEVRLRPMPGEAAGPDPLWGTPRQVLVFRAAAPAAAPGAWPEEDRATARLRLTTLAGADAFEVTALGGYLFFSTPWHARAMRPEAEARCASDARAALAAKGVVSFRRIVDPAHGTLPAYRMLLDRALAGGDRPIAVPISPAERPASDVSAGTFPEGVFWCRIEAEVCKGVHYQWRHEGYMLLEQDSLGISQADIAWAYLSEARLGAAAPTRDIYYRLRDSSLERARQLTAGVRGRFLALLVDGELVCGLQLGVPHGIEGEVLDVPLALAPRVLIAFATPPLHADYTFEGSKPESFMQAVGQQDDLDRVFGKEGIRLRWGAIGDIVFLTTGRSTELAAETIARIRSPRQAVAPALARASALAPKASFLIRVDISRLAAQFSRLMEALAGRPLPPFLPGMPADLEPALLAGWREGGRLRLRARIDHRLLALLGESEEESHVEAARWGGTKVAAAAGQWRTQYPNADLPAIDALPVNPLDPWGEVYRIEELPRDGGVFRAISAGPDGLFGTTDDIAVDEE